MHALVGDDVLAKIEFFVGEVVSGSESVAGFVDDAVVVFERCLFVRNDSGRPTFFVGDVEGVPDGIESRHDGIDTVEIAEEEEFVEEGGVAEFPDGGIDAAFVGDVELFVGQVVDESHRPAMGEVEGLEELGGGGHGNR